MAGELGRNGAQRIGAGDDDGVIARRIFFLERQRLEPQHRREQDLETSATQAIGSGLAISLRARDKNGHSSGFQERHLGLNRRLHAVTSQCYRMTDRR
jgi:hypothetical protein